ncbi:tetratricopeptide repeat protein [Porticoccus sp. W117]|uniref:tetratricopeptide repeat protein n=1 Tax=Porticoccus sp. W117 TaxID=3054777 RepID=UPI002597D348|nr:tetratricopeptide repeat protein [Porticoccus sp. W117]MDM3871110.1 tetratricopeptide repeat protein [Porticoccus sp. W117]
MHIKHLLLTIFLLLTFPVSALEIAEIEALFAHNKVSELQALKKSTTDTGYQALFLDYRLAAALIQNGDKKPAKTILNSAIKNAKVAIKTAPESLHSEYQALLGALYGLKIIVKPFSAIGLNRKATKALKASQALQAENPRALLMLGVAKFQTPALFGGSSQEALALLQQGLKASEKNSQINWGTVDLHLWLGRVLSKRKQPDLALTHYQKALEISPDNYWVIEAMKGNGFDAGKEE